MFFDADGRLYTATPVDPVFIFLPVFDDARMKVLLSIKVHNLTFGNVVPRIISLVTRTKSHLLSAYTHTIANVYFACFLLFGFLSLTSNYVSFECRKVMILESSGNWMR